VNQHINYLFYSTKKKDIKGQAQRLALFLFSFSFFIKGANNVSSDDKKNGSLFACLTSHNQVAGK